MSKDKTKDGGTTTCKYIQCSNGEVETALILSTINCLIDSLTALEACCDTVSSKNKIRTYRAPGVPNILYMTDDGSDPHP